MNFLRYLLIIFALGGCTMNSYDMLRKGVAEKRVLELKGTPDLISERSGDLLRGYEGGFLPEYKWPKSTIKKYYYFETETVITIQYNKVISIETISKEDKEMVHVLLDMIEKGEGISGVKKEN